MMVDPPGHGRTSHATRLGSPHGVQRGEVWGRDPGSGGWAGPGAAAVQGHSLVGPVPSSVIRRGDNTWAACLLCACVWGRGWGVQGGWSLRNLSAWN